MKLNNLKNSIFSIKTLDIIFWFFIFYLPFIEKNLYFLLIDILIIIKIYLKFKTNQKFTLNKYFVLLFSLFFILCSLSLFFYQIKFHPFLFCANLIFILIFAISDFRFENAKYVLFFLPFLSIGLYFLNNQQEASFIYKHSSLLGMLLILALITYRKKIVFLLPCILAIFLTFSKTTYIALIIIIVFIALNSIKKKKIKTLAPYIAVIIFLIIIMGSLFMKSVKDDPFVLGRFNIWKTAIKMGVDNFPFGVGGFNFKFYSSEYKPVKLSQISPELDYYKNYLQNKNKLKIFNLKTPKDEHNIILKLFAQYGFTGLLFTLFFTLYLIKNYLSLTIEKKLFLINIIFFSLIQNFFFNYLLLLPLISIISKTKIKTKKISIKKIFVLMFAIFYFLFFSFPYYSSSYLYKKNPKTALKILPFDYRARYGIFQKKLNSFLSTKSFSDLLQAKIEAAKVQCFNNRLEIIYLKLALAYSSLLGSSIYENFAYSELQPLYKKLQRIAPHNPSIYFNYAKLLLSKRQIEKSEKTLFKALQIEPYYIRALKLLKMVYLKKGNSKKAVFLEKTIKKIKKDKKKYKYIGASNYERIILMK